MRFITIEDAVHTGGRTKLYPQLAELKELTVKAWNEDYEPDSRQEEEAIEAIRHYGDSAWAVIEETDTAAVAYSRAAGLRKANLPKGTWEFKGQKVVDEDGNEGGQVLARYVSTEDPNPLTDDSPEGEEE